MARPDLGAPYGLGAYVETDAPGIAADVFGAVLFATGDGSEWVELDALPLVGDPGEEERIGRVVLCWDASGGARFWPPMALPPGSITRTGDTVRARMAAGFRSPGGVTAITVRPVTPARWNRTNPNDPKPDQDAVDAALIAMLESP